MDEVITAPPIQGSAPESAPQATAPASSPQEVAQPQTKGENQVEVPESQATSQPTERPKPKPVSFYANQRREKEQIRQMADSIKRMTEELTALKSKPPVDTAKPEVSDEELEKQFWAQGPKLVKKMLAEQKSEYEQRIKDILENDLPKRLESRESQKIMESKRQEAFDMLFPKSSPDSQETIEERINRDPKRKEAIDQIGVKFGLDKMLQEDPIRAASIALEFYKLSNPAEPPRSPLAAKKSQMAPTSSGTPPGGSKMNTNTDLIAKYGQMQERLSDDPSLLQNETFRNEWELLKSEMTKNIKPK